MKEVRRRGDLTGVLGILPFASKLIKLNSFSCCWNKLNKCSSNINCNKRYISLRKGNTKHFYKQVTKIYSSYRYSKKDKTSSSKIGRWF